MKMLFNDWERKYIIEFYRNPSWWRKSIIVTRYESLKTKRNFDKAIMDTWLFKIITRILDKSEKILAKS